MSKLQWLGLAAASILALIETEAANAESGVVAYYKSGCDYYIVAASRGYAVLEWYGGDDPIEGDKLVGSITYGMQTLVNLRTESETQAWVEEFMLSKESAVSTYMEQCN